MSEQRKYWKTLPVIAVVVLTVTACVGGPTIQERAEIWGWRSLEAERILIEVKGRSDIHYVDVVYDPAHGVVCYLSGVGISCVKVGK